MQTTAWPKDQPVCVCDNCGKDLVLLYDIETYWIHVGSSYYCDE